MSYTNSASYKIYSRNENEMTKKRLRCDGCDYCNDCDDCDDCNDYYDYTKTDLRVQIVEFVHDLTNGKKRSKSELDDMIDYIAFHARVFNEMNPTDILIIRYK